MLLINYENVSKEGVVIELRTELCLDYFCYVRAADFAIHSWHNDGLGA